MDVEARGHPVSGDRSYKFERYLYVTPAALTDVEEYPWLIRYSRNGVRKPFVRRSVPLSYRNGRG